MGIDDQIKLSFLKNSAKAIRSHLGSPIQIPAIAMQAMGVVVLSSLVAFLVFWFYPDDPSWHLTILREQVDQYKMVYTKPQRMAYLTLLACLTLGSVLSCCFHAKGKTLIPSPTLFGILSGLLGLGLLMSQIELSSQGYFILAVRGFYVIAVFALAIVLSFTNRNIWIIWALIGVLCAMAIVPGLISTGVPRWNLPAIDAHFAGVLSQGERLAAGHLLYVDNTPGYGTLVPIIIGILSKMGTTLSFGELGRLTQFAQTASFIIVLLTAWRLTMDASPAKRALAILIVMMTVTLWFANNFVFVWFPNQTGIRYFALFSSVLVVARCQNFEAKSFGVITGLTAMFALFWNLETGIAATAGLGMAWLVVVRRQTKAIAFISALAGGFAFFGLFAVIGLTYHGIFGGWPWPSSTGAAISRLALFSGGYSGLKFSFSPLPIIIILHAAYIFVRLIQSLLKPGEELVTPINAMIATTLLVWFPYFINRAENLNLWTMSVLYVLILAPLFIRLKQPNIALTFIAAMIVSYAWIVSPDFVGRLATQKNLVLGWKTGCADGVIVDEVICKKLVERADALKKLASKGRIYWSTGVPFLTMRMTGQYGALSMIDSYAFATTKARWHRLLSEIRRLNPKMIVVDDPEDRTLKFDPNLTKFHSRLTAAFSGRYCVEKRMNGWKIIERSTHCPQQ